MAKVTTFSRYFPKTHPSSGEPTYFVEQILHQQKVNYKSRKYFLCLLDLNRQKIDEGKLTRKDIMDFQDSLVDDVENFKHHTIRNGFRYKQDEYFSPRVWSKNPYNSPQIIFLPLTIIKKTYEIEIKEDFEILLNGRCLGGVYNVLVANNDGLYWADFKNWFSKLPFSGQIICWSETINY